MIVISSYAHFCSNKSEKEAKNEGLRFYRIPKNVERQRLWFNGINRKDFNPGPSTSIRSVHFVGGEYDLLVHG